VRIQTEDVYNYTNDMHKGFALGQSVDYGMKWRIMMATKLLLELKNLLADLASTLILGKNKDAARLALTLSEKSKALAEELVK